MKSTHALLILRASDGIQFNTTHSVHRALMRQRHQAKDTVWHITYIMPSSYYYAYAQDGLKSYYEVMETAVHMSRHAARLLNVPMNRVQLYHQTLQSVIPEYQKSNDAIGLVVGYVSFSHILSIQAGRLWHRLVYPLRQWGRSLKINLSVHGRVKKIQPRKSIISL